MWEGWFSRSERTEKVLITRETFPQRVSNHWRKGLFAYTARSEADIWFSQRRKEGKLRVSSISGSAPSYDLFHTLTSHFAFVVDGSLWWHVEIVQLLELDYILIEPVLHCGMGNSDRVVFDWRSELFKNALKISYVKGFQPLTRKRSRFSNKTVSKRVYRTTSDCVTYFWKFMLCQSAYQKSTIMFVY